VKNRFKFKISIAIFTLVFAGCSSSSKVSHPDDPFESFNRASYQFNSKLDKYMLKPIAQVYDTVTPNPVKKGVLNFFVNLGEVSTMSNDLLQGHPIYAAKDFFRFAINSTIGVAGTIDIATHMQFPRRYNDFGITLAKWGVKRSPYLVIPFIGPSTFRDGLGLLVNLKYLTLWPYIKPNSLRNSLFALDIISLRSALLDADGVMKEAALDPYVFIRNAYLQKRSRLIYSNSELSGENNGQGSDPLGQDNLDFALGTETGAPTDSPQQQISEPPL